ncbi:hypothetical protein P0D88_42230 [Paraburkholderia sp. RL18-103-BIB-C]|uniref:hypothetical protein n=1 Tax=unclassified Paraburkholderia TaxID=2615204 RepID=UPI0038BDD418
MSMLTEVMCWGWASCSPGGRRDGSLGELVEWFAQEGIARKRFDFRPRASVSVYLLQHYHVDICLDTFPFSGLTTALHSLWIGVPTLAPPRKTVPGPQQPDRAVARRTCDVHRGGAGRFRVPRRRAGR